MIDLPLGEFRSAFGAGVGLRFLSTELQLVGLRIHPRDFFSTSPLVDSHFAWDGSSTRRLLQTSIHALPITRPGQVPVPNDQCAAAEPSVLSNCSTAVETHSDRHRSTQCVWLTAWIDEQVSSAASSYSAVISAVQLTIGNQNASDTRSESRTKLQPRFIILNCFISGRLPDVKTLTPPINTSEPDRCR